jgi:hypothetical protein
MLQRPIQIALPATAFVSMATQHPGQGRLRQRLEDTCSNLVGGPLRGWTGRLIPFVTMLGWHCQALAIRRTTKASFRPFTIAATNTEEKMALIDEAI